MYSSALLQVSIVRMSVCPFTIYYDKVLILILSCVASLKVSHVVGCRSVFCLLWLYVQNKFLVVNNSAIMVCLSVIGDVRNIWYFTLSYLTFNGFYLFTFAIAYSSTFIFDVILIIFKFPHFLDWCCVTLAHYRPVYRRLVRG